jgi:hypothetical protein
MLIDVDLRTGRDRLHSHPAEEGAKIRRRGRDAVAGTRVARESIGALHARPTMRRRSNGVNEYRFALSARRVVDRRRQSHVA